ncbi:hypothetical protein PSTG_05427 [Puccinia striiformis f. sp. tritici PST-78]|uniref:CxC1-like cysteine cluster associated with KDZ transposases domain-containing protein n=1 Tax=Puccinia striiformis f. sp. tritici PST-78 TaxID=1165861 RepID=A0A0L0VPW3_9BASI|nr:hypothetical protein PSTG_05427 [Puccinia striiformis f. sp. tritici PST-78]
MSSAVDAYREMLRREKNFTERLLKMQPIDKLSDICPKCFGPLVLGKKEHEPDYILCMDANFQQRRHVASSVEIHSKPETPSLFIDPDKVQLMENGMKEDNQEGESVDQMDRCTEQHTAANDVRGSNTWKACDDTGIFGMACRHDQVLRLINIFGSGENEERESNQLMFGTSVFHAHVHEWLCQLRYNPRLNDEWGMSDGEGLERIWSYLSPLIGPLRYSTRNHRLAALDSRSCHHNEVGKTHALKLLLDRGKHIEKTMNSSCNILKEVMEQFGHTGQYVRGQWNRQRQCQLSLINNGPMKELEEQVEDLVELEVLGLGL